MRKRIAAMLARTTGSAFLNYLFPSPKTAPIRVPFGGGKRYILPKPRVRGPSAKRRIAGGGGGNLRKRIAAMLARTTGSAFLNYLFPPPKTAPVRVPFGGGRDTYCRNPAYGAPRQSVALRAAGGATCAKGLPQCSRELPGRHFSITSSHRQKRHP